MARTWLSIRVELVSGLGGRLWPRLGRIFAASRSHTFEQLSKALEDGFASGRREKLHVSPRIVAGADVYLSG
jgi:hypothetical protein